MPMLAMPEDWDRAVVVAAHPDDIEYGIASAVARWTGQGKQVSYLLATRGEAGIAGLHPDQVGPLRVEEERRGAALVGVTEVEFLDHPDWLVCTFRHLPGRAGPLFTASRFQRLSAYFPSWRAADRLMSALRSVPNFLIWLFWILVAIILVVVAALIIHHFGGFALTFHIGDFRFDLGVT
jgi:LmbE family N-acetylglucosaminyl deacetylase